MSQLTLKDIYDLAKDLLEKGEDLSQYQVYLGNDDELNGIHTAWYGNILDVNHTDERSILVDMIKEDCCNVPLKNKGILIS